MKKADSCCSVLCCLSGPCSKFLDMILFRLWLLFPEQHWCVLSTYCHSSSFEQLVWELSDDGESPCVLVSSLFPVGDVYH